MPFEIEVTYLPTITGNIEATVKTTETDLKEKLAKDESIHATAEDAKQWVNTTIQKHKDYIKKWKSVKLPENITLTEE